MRVFNLNTKGVFEPISSLIFLKELMKCSFTTKLTTIIFILSLSLFIFFLFLQPISAQTDNDWVITSFHSDIVINQDTSVKVIETIKVDFGLLQKHGIYRTIPIKYKDKLGNNLDIRFQLIKVTDGTGTLLNIAEQTYENENVKIKIGDPDQTISGEQTYVIVYQVNRVITELKDSAEFYWNVTGNQWFVPILKASATVSAPEKSLQNTICFADYLGGSSQNCQHDHDQTTANFESDLLNPQQGLTIALTLDPTTLTFPSFWQKLNWFLMDNWAYALPLLILLIMTRLWWVRGRDKRYRDIFNETGDIETVPLFEKLDPLMVFGPPKNLSPGEVGLLVDEKVHLRDITAIMIDLARRGYFIIKELPKKGLFGKIDFELIHKEKGESDLQEFEKEVLNMLFGKIRKNKVRLSKLPKNAYKYLKASRKKLYEHLEKTGYFEANPEKVRTIYLTVGIGIAIVGSFLTLMFNTTTLPVKLFIPMTSGLIIIFFSFFMPARSPKGRKALKEIVGLKEWIRLGAWREQIHEKHNFFEEVLPYTIAFGLTYKFINAFKAADLKRLDWYQSSKPLNITRFSSSIDSLGSSLNKGVAATRPKSASSGGSGFSGGFSGGGFGGGGGGSW